MYKRTANCLSVNSGELYAILMALHWTEQIQHHKVLMCSDSVSAIKSIGIGTSCSRQALTHEILCAIREVTRRGIEVSLMWVPAHIGIPTNEKVDKLAKKKGVKRKTWI